VFDTQTGQIDHFPRPASRFSPAGQPQDRVHVVEADEPEAPAAALPALVVGGGDTPQNRVNHPARERGMEFPQPPGIHADTCLSF
jgi:hypothetical protein